MTFTADGAAAAAALALENGFTTYTDYKQDEYFCARPRQIWLKVADTEGMGKARVDRGGTARANAGGVVAAQARRGQSVSLLMRNARGAGAEGVADGWRDGKSAQLPELFVAAEDSAAAESTSSATAAGAAAPVARARAMDCPSVVSVSVVSNSIVTNSTAAQSVPIVGAHRRVPAAAAASVCSVESVSVGAGVGAAVS